MIQTYKIIKRYFPHPKTNGHNSAEQHVKGDDHWLRNCEIAARAFDGEMSAIHPNSSTIIVSWEILN